MILTSPWHHVEYPTSSTKMMINWGIRRALTVPMSPGRASVTVNTDGRPSAFTESGNNTAAVAPNASSGACLDPTENGSIGGYRWAHLGSVWYLCRESRCGESDRPSRPPETLKSFPAYVTPLSRSSATTPSVSGVAPHPDELQRLNTAPPLYSTRGSSQNPDRFTRPCCILGANRA